MQHLRLEVSYPDLTRQMLVASTSFVLTALEAALFSVVSSRPFMAVLNPRIPSPIPLPSSGSFLGPNTSRAIPKITSRCMGWNNPSSITPPQIGDARRYRQETETPEKSGAATSSFASVTAPQPATQANSD